MDVIAHCRVYPLSTFYSPAEIFIDWLQRDNYGNVVEGKDGVCVGKIGFLHMIEHGFVFSTFKSKLARQLLKELPPQSALVVIDVVSGWKQFVDDFQEEDKQIFYMNSPSLLHFDTLINFLVQLNEDPEEALRRCHTKCSTNLQLAGVVLDNISYYTHDEASYELLFKILRMLRQNYGSLVITIGYGLEYYDGVEKAADRDKLLTSLPDYQCHT